MISKKEAVSIFNKHLHDNAKSISRVTKGVSSIVYRITTASDEDFYFNQGDNNYKIQYLLNQKLKAKGIKTPDIIDFSTNWLLLKGVVGQELNLNDKTNLDALIEFGEQTALVHSYKTEGFGPLISISNGKHESYTEYRRKIAGVISKDFLDVIHDYLQASHITNLNHGDLFFSHVFVNKLGKFTSLIDWDDIISAPKECDLAELLLSIENDRQVWSLFMKGYSKYADYVEIDNRNLLIEELIQAYDSYRWQTTKEVKDYNKIAYKKLQFQFVENILRKHI